MFHRTFAAVATGIILIALVWGFVIVGGPGSSRQQRFDDRRLEDLRMIHGEITTIVYGGQPWRGPDAPEPTVPAPATLEEVVQKAYYQRPNIMDPETGIPYAYTVLSPTLYRLCAVFNTERHLSYDIRWNHPAGEHCYEFDVTEETDNPKPLTAPIRETAVPPAEPKPAAAQ